MHKVRKPWYRKDRKCWVVYWLSDGKQKSKAFPNKKTAEAFQARKQHQLNEDIWPDPVAMPWGELVEEFLFHQEKVKGNAPDTLRIHRDTLGNFKAINGRVKSTQVTQRHIDKYVVKRLEAVDRATINKELRSLRALVNWAAHKGRRYMSKGQTEIEWPMQSIAEKKPRALTEGQLENLCIAAKRRRVDYYLRVLLAVVTGLRRGDIERLRVSDIDFEGNTVKTRSKKTRKENPGRPLPVKIVDELTKYIDTLPEGEDHLFPHQYQHKDWKRIRAEAGVPDLKFHDLRVTFASLLAQKGVSQSVVQELLEHSDPRLTHRVYTDVSPVFRAAVETIPLAKITGL